MSVVSISYTAVDNQFVAETSLALARQYDRNARLVGATALGREGVDSLFVTLVTQWSPTDLYMLSHNTHGGEGALQFRLVEVDRRSGAVLCAPSRHRVLKESHSGNVVKRLDAKLRIDAGQQWIENYVNDSGPDLAELEARFLMVRDAAPFVDHLWPQSEESIWVERGQALHPRTHLLESELGHQPDGLTALTLVCSFIDRLSEAREAGDVTRDRDERLARGAGDKLKQRAWRGLLDSYAWDGSEPDDLP